MPYILSKLIYHNKIFRIQTGAPLTEEKCTQVVFQNNYRN
nr:RteC domain-containing protein [Olivibacter sp. XZL3]